MLTSKMLKIRDSDSDNFISLLGITSFLFLKNASGENEDIIVCYGHDEFLRIDKSAPDYPKLFELIEVMEKAKLVVTLDEVIEVLGNLAKMQDMHPIGKPVEYNKEASKEILLQKVEEAIAQKNKMIEEKKEEENN